MFIRSICGEIERYNTTAAVAHVVLQMSFVVTLSIFHYNTIHIDPPNNSHNALDKYSTMHHFVTEMHISVTKWCIVGYGTGTFRGLCNWSIGIPHRELRCKCCIGNTPSLLLSLQTLLAAVVNVTDTRGPLVCSRCFNFRPHSAWELTVYWSARKSIPFILLIRDCI